MKTSLLDANLIFGKGHTHGAMLFFAILLTAMECLRTVGFISLDISHAEIIPLMLLPVLIGCWNGHILSDKLLLLFILYIPYNIIVTNPPPVFQSWIRFGLFLSAILCISPFLQTGTLRVFRLYCLRTFLWIILPLSAISFFCYFTGVNFLISGYGVFDYNVSVGAFSALFNHSIILGVMSAVSACFTFWHFLKGRRRLLFAVLTILCAGATMFSASRSALFGTLLACVVMVYFNSHNKSKNLRVLLVCCIIGCCSFPVWESALDGIRKKNDINQRLGAYGSRTEKFEARIAEIKSSPVFGVGFSAIDIKGRDYYNAKTGVVEPGSSWLGVMSMTGILGFAMVLSIFIRAYRILFKSPHPVASLMIGLLTFVSFHCLFEGYLLAGGSVLCFMSWLIIGVSTDMKYAATSRTD